MTSAPAEAPDPVIVSAPAPTRIRYQTVPTVNRRAEALEEALRREVDLFPRHKPIVDRILSAAGQIDHGQSVQQADRGVDAKNRGGLGWTD